MKYALKRDCSCAATVYAVGQYVAIDTSAAGI